jgi:hypothetical protein
MRGIIFIAARRTDAMENTLSTRERLSAARVFPTDDEDCYATRCEILTADEFGVQPGVPRMEFRLQAVRLFAEWKETA